MKSAGTASPRRRGRVLAAFSFLVGVQLGVAGGASAATFDADPASLGSIPDGTSLNPGSWGDPRNVTFTVTGVDGPPAVGLSLTANHTWVGDLEVVLIAPNGTTQHTIFSRTGANSGNDKGDTDNLGGTYSFFDAAPESPSWWDAAALSTNAGLMPPGSYRTSQPGPVGFPGALNTSMNAAFSGLTSSDGTWTLRVRDGTGGDTGSVSGATLTLMTRPTLSATNPASPANDNSPRVAGVAEAGSQVQLFTTADCTGAPVGAGTAAELAGAGIAAAVPDDATTQLRATVTSTNGVASPCSAPISYTEDSTAPDVPSIDGVAPGSPANNVNPVVRGAAASGSTVRIFAGADCLGAPLATASAAEFATPGIAVRVPANATSSLRASAADSAGNASPCSAPMQYTEDSAAPDTTATTAKPKVKTKKKRVNVSFSFESSEAGSTFECSLDGGAFETCTSPRSYAMKKGTHTVAVRATDRAGNRDATPATSTVKVKRKKRKRRPT